MGETSEKMIVGCCCEVAGEGRSLPTVGRGLREGGGRWHGEGRRRSAGGGPWKNAGRVWDGEGNKLLYILFKF